MRRLNLHAGKVAVGAAENLRYLTIFQNMRPEAQVAMWPFVKTTEAIAYDISGNGRHGVNVGDVFAAPSRIQGYEVPTFDGDTYVNLYSTSLRDAFPNGKMTLFINAINPSWAGEEFARTLVRFYCDANNDIRIYKNQTTGGLYVTRKANGKALLGAIGAGEVATDEPFSLCMTVDPTAPILTCFYNGAAFAEFTADVDMITALITSTNAYVAKPSAAGRGWLNSAAFVGLWNDALTADEVAVLSKKANAVPVIHGDGLTIAFIPDTQSYVQNSQSSFMFNRQTQWLVDNQENYSIFATVHEGDVVENIGSADEWLRADAAMDILDAVEMPYLTCIGNHDWDNKTTRDTSTFNNYFPQVRYTSRNWWNGDFFEAGHSENAYMLLSAEGIDFIFITLEDTPRSEVITWANGLLTTYAARKAIITTHAYLEIDGTILSSYEYIWTDLLNLHDNIILLQCGHRVLPYEGAARRVDLNAHGIPVHQILADYQHISGVAGTGAGYMRLVTLKPSTNKIMVQTFSPTELTMKTDANNQFELDYQF
jgi:hypothetical protein